MSTRAKSVNPYSLCTNVHVNILVEYSPGSETIGSCTWIIANAWHCFVYWVVVGPWKIRATHPISPGLHAPPTSHDPAARPWRQHRISASRHSFRPLGWQMAGRQARRRELQTEWEELEEEQRANRGKTEKLGREAVQPGNGRV